MKRFLLFTFIVFSVVATALAERIGTMKIRGVMCQYDTLIHRTVGPGVTYTQFQFDNMKIGGSIPYKMRTHLLVIDMTNKNNRVSPYMSKGKYYEIATQEQEYRRQKNLGLKPIATVNCMGFVQSPPLKSEPYTYMETLYNQVTDGLVRYESDVKRERYYTDDNRKGNLGALTMKATVTSSKGATAAIGQINHYRDHVRKTNKLALFCNGMDKAKDTNPNDGVEVFLEGGDITVGTNKLVVANRKSGCGGSIGSDQHVITGVGTEIESFLNGLEVGETVTLEVGYVDATGKSVMLTDTYTAFIPNCVKNGVPLGDKRSNVAYTATGVSKDGNTLYLADLEISQYSNPPLRCLEDFLIEVGAWNACYNDGGPSAEMTVDGKFVSINSIGGGFNGRYCPNGIMVYSTAMDDAQLVHVECADPSKKRLSVGDSFTLKLYGYNQYDEMIDDDAISHSAVEVSYPQNLLQIDRNGKVTAKAKGNGEIRIDVRDHGTQIRIPFSIGEKTGLILEPNNVFTGENRPVQLKVKYYEGDKTTDVDPIFVTWSVDDPYVVSSCRNGLIVPYVDGYATVTASYNGVSAEAAVVVENLEAEDIPYIDLADEVSSLSDINLYLPSVPHSIYLETVPKDDELIFVKFTTGDKEQVVALMNEGAGIVNCDTITLDYDAPDTYPVMIKSISPSNTELKRLAAVYTDYPTAINDLYADKASLFEFSRSGNDLMLINCSDDSAVLVSVYNFNGVKLSELQTNLQSGGSCTLNVNTSEPVIVRVKSDSGVQVFKLVR